jgi:hypothetical protein
MARPDLTSAHPSGAIAGTFRPVGRASVEVLMGDGTWGYAAVIGWARDISGRWRVLLLWYAPEGQREDWYLYDPARVCLVQDEDPPARPLATQRGRGKTPRAGARTTPGPQNWERLGKEVISARSAG